jgi:hypothetical protein
MFDRTIEVIEPYFNPGEQVLWTGQPRAGIILRTADLLLVPFSLMWGGFAFFWEFTVLTTSAPLLFKLWGIPFVLVGLYMIVGRFFFDAGRRANTFYALTDQRAIVVSKGLGGQIKSFGLRNPVELTLEQKPDLSGTIAFGAMQPAIFRGMGMGAAPNFPQPLMFEEIPNAGEVYQLVQRAQRQAQRA